MTSKRFLIFVFLGLGAVAAVIIPLNMYTDIYGLFRAARGRPVTVYGEERVAKYLHSFRYIPENFDGVILGSSVSAILDARDFEGYRIYNASIDGGNVEDLKPIAENIFKKGRLKVTIICVHRYLTNDHNQKTDLITPKEYWGALGSPQLLTAYVSRMAIGLGLVRARYDEYGTKHFASDPDSSRVRTTISEAVSGIERGTESVGNYYIDPVAFAELRDVLTLARGRSRQLIMFFPPVPAPILAVRSAEYAGYREVTSSLLDPHDVVVDFNAPNYENLRSDVRNFVDAVHLSRRGARLVMVELAKAASESIAPGGTLAGRAMQGGQNSGIMPANAPLVAPR